MEHGTSVDGAETLEALSREELIDLLQIYAKNLVAMDGVWFQSLESEQGMDAAMHHDEQAWKRFTISEARRIKNFLGLSARPGLQGLADALALKFTTVANVSQCVFVDDALVFRIVDCRVQNARQHKGIVFHPCKSVGQVEYEGFAKMIDDRIECECLSCFPELNDETCNCSWKFTLKETHE